MGAVANVLGMIARLTQQFGRPPTHLEMHPDYFDATVREMRQTGMRYEARGIGVTLGGVPLIASTRAKELNERAVMADQPQ